MASWITSSIALLALAAVCLGFEHGEELHHFEGGLGGGEELLEHHKPEIHHEHEHKVATSYQNFKLESKNPVPVIIKKEAHHHHHPEEHEIGLEHHEHLGHHIEGF